MRAVHALKQQRVGVALVGYQPLIARTQTVHRPVGPVAYDCVKLIVIRSGSAILYSEFGEQPVKVGDAVLLGANVLCGSEPEGYVTVTTVPRQVVGRISGSGKLGTVGSASPRWTCDGRFQASASWGRMVLNSAR